MPWSCIKIGRANPVITGRHMHPTPKLAFGLNVIVFNTIKKTLWKLYLSFSKQDCTTRLQILDVDSSFMWFYSITFTAFEVFKFSISH